MGKRDGYKEELGIQGYGERNEEGNRILQMTQSLQLFCVNTRFTKPGEHLITHKSGEKVHRAR